MGMVATEAAQSVGVNCCECGTAFWMEGGIYNARKRDHDSFWCPNGHEQHFVGEREEDRLRRQVEQKDREIARQQQMRAWAEGQAKGANIKAGKAKAALRRTMERVHAGVCPHCNRTFKQLAAHMQAKHASE